MLRLCRVAPLPFCTASIVSALFVNDAERGLEAWGLDGRGDREDARPDGDGYRTECCPFTLRLGLDDLTNSATVRGR